ncbi:MAG: hypothetical protein ACR2QF_06195 [Geminicoccaceae bacterium]
MASFRPARIPSRFDPRLPMVFVRPWAGFRTGDPVPKMRWFRKRRLYRLRAIEYAEVPEPVEETAQPPTIEAPVETTGEEDVVAVSAEEGAKGWWEVTYSDGSTKKTRRAEVEDLGLLDSVQEPDGVVDDGHQSPDPG